jgi:hypothetical protein
MPPRRSVRGGENTSPLTGEGRHPSLWPGRAYDAPGRKGLMRQRRDRAAYLARPRLPPRAGRPVRHRSAQAEPSPTGAAVNHEPTNVLGGRTESKSVARTRRTRPTPDLGALSRGLGVGPAAVAVSTPTWFTGPGAARGDHWVIPGPSARQALQPLCHAAFTFASAAFRAGATAIRPRST